jgi:hypothetical protein
MVVKSYVIESINDRIRHPVVIYLTTLAYQYPFKSNWQQTSWKFKRKDWPNKLNILPIHWCIYSNVYGKKNDLCPQLSCP